MHHALERWREIAERVFPEDARIIELPARTPHEANEWRLLVSWRLGTDPARPSKRSKIVQIVIDDEALEDYAHSPIGARFAADARLEAWLRAKWESFDGDHDTQERFYPPVVPWKVGTRDLNG